MDPITIDTPSSLIINLTAATASPPASSIAIAVPDRVPHPQLEEDLISVLQRAIDRILPSDLLSDLRIQSRLRYRD